MGVILVTHDLSVVAETCSRVAVMYLGQIVEESPVSDLFGRPGHPYTLGLVQSIPRLHGERPRRLYVIEGTVPAPGSVQSGCRFAPRCVFAEPHCREQTPELTPIGEGRSARCWKAGDF
jgi:oligopeptide/dipeptide ABC transporter ATP-binding protein